MYHETFIMVGFKLYNLLLYQFFAGVSCLNVFIFGEMELAQVKCYSAFRITPRGTVNT